MFLLLVVAVLNGLFVYLTSFRLWCVQHITLTDPSPRLASFVVECLLEIIKAFYFSVSNINVFCSLRQPLHTCNIQRLALKFTLFFSCNFSAILHLNISASLLITSGIIQDCYFISIAEAASNAMLRV